MDEVTVVTSVKALNGGVGQIFLDRVCSSFKTTRYLRLIPVGGMIPGLLGKAISKAVLKSKFVGFIDFLFDIIVMLPVLTVYLSVSKRNSSIVVTMSSRAIYRGLWMAAYFKTNKALVAVVWDMPSYILDFNSRRFEWINRLDHWFFNKIIDNSDSVVTMGKRMDQALALRVNQLPPTIHLRSPVVANLKQGDARQPGEPLKFVFAGSIYAKDAWNAFVNAMSAKEWEIDGVRIELHLIGAVPASGVELPSRIIQYGPLALRQVFEVLQRCHVGYSPYSFAHSFKEAASTSFPGKISDYAASGIPFFYHGPKESEAYDSIQRSGSAVSCTSIDAPEIIHAVKEVIKNHDALTDQVPNYIKNELSFEIDEIFSRIWG